MSQKQGIKTGTLIIVKMFNVKKRLGRTISGVKDDGTVRPSSRHVRKTKDRF